MNLVIIAHFDPKGFLSSDLSEFINFLDIKGFSVYFVSTGINEEYISQLNKTVRVLIRDNYGYDFYSYAKGFANNLDLIDSFENIIVMNSSFKIISLEKLYSFFELATNDFYKGIDLLSLTESNEVTYHCQSFVMRFNKKLITSKSFVDWWVRMKPISNRQKVINKYELGLTKFVKRKGFITGGLFNITLERKVKAMELYHDAYGRYEDFDNLNPCHFMWSDLLDDYGIIKYELLKKNPHRLELFNYNDNNL